MLNYVEINIKIKFDSNLLILLFGITWSAFITFLILIKYTNIESLICDRQEKIDPPARKKLIH